MDGNKDEAIKCLKIVKNAIESGDTTRALKFLNKARRLYPSIEIDEFLSDSQPEDKNPDEPDSKTPFNPLPDGASASGPTSPSSSSTYTEEQVSVVREIERKKDYYEILGLEKKCSAEDIRKAYRKLSLKVHPDKNRAPGAEDSFKKVSKAFQCLSNEESRIEYDLVGSDEQGGGNANGMRGFNADEIFRNFFSGGMPNSGGYTANSSGFTPNSGGFTPNWGGYTANSGAYTANSGGFTANWGGFAANSGGYAPNSGGFTANSGGYTPNNGGFTANSGGYTVNSGGYTFGGPGVHMNQLTPQQLEQWSRAMNQLLWAAHFAQHMRNYHQ